jgi:GDPmannose 4,6-dehydratase
VIPSSNGKRALITGVTGQDGSYLAEQLLAKGYDVYGLVRRLSTPNPVNIRHLLGRLKLLDGDLLDESSLYDALRRSEPDEIYNLAAQSFVGVSFNQPILTGNVTGLGALRLLEAMRSRADRARFYQASSSEMFGLTEREPQDETTGFHPQSPYGFSKVLAFHAAVNYRESYGLFVANGILFNHESERRGLEFVTRKISDGVARIHLGLASKITLGSLAPRRDWGYAPEYTDLMWRILQHTSPDDFVGATGETHSIEEFLREAFRCVGVDDWARFVDHDPRLTRPSDVDRLRGDAGKARERLGWEPKVRFPELVRRMVRSDLTLHQTRGVVPASPVTPV